MKDCETLHSVEVCKNKNLILSVAGAVILSAIGFGLIFLFAAWLNTPRVIWKANHPHIAIFPLTAFFTSAFALSVSIQTVRKRRFDRKKPSDPKQKMLPL